MPIFNNLSKKYLDLIRVLLVLFPPRTKCSNTTHFLGDAPQLPQSTYRKSPESASRSTPESASPPPPSLESLSHHRVPKNTVHKNDLPQLPSLQQPLLRRRLRRRIHNLLLPHPRSSHTATSSHPHSHSQQSLPPKTQPQKTPPPSAHDLFPARAPPEI